MDPIFLGGALAFAVFVAGMIGGVVGACIATPGVNPHRCPLMPAPPPPPPGVSLTEKLELANWESDHLRKLLREKECQLIELRRRRDLGVR